jgi:hypothetical protein
MAIECLYNKSNRKKDVEKLPVLSKDRERLRDKKFTASAEAVAAKNTKTLLQRRVVC